MNFLNCKIVSYDTVLTVTDQNYNIKTEGKVPFKNFF